MRLFTATEINDFMKAASEGDFEIIYKSLSKGLNINCRDRKRRTPLFYALQSGNKDMVEMLIELGADLKDVGGEPALHVAILWGRERKPHIVKYLLDCGVDIHAKSILNTNALYAAALKKEEELVKFLIAGGVDVNNSELYSGKTVLMISLYMESTK